MKTPTIDTFSGKHKTKMKKKKYIRPAIEIVCTECEYGVLKHVYSMNVDEDHKWGENGNEDGAAGAKPNLFGNFEEESTSLGSNKNLWE